MGASMMGRLDVLRLTDEALRVAEAANDIKASLHLRVGPSYVRVSNGDLSMVRALVIDAIAAGENYPAFAAATGLTECLAYLGQCEELGAACRAALSTKAQAFDLLDSAAGPARAVGDHLAGELDAAIERLPATRSAWELMTRMWAEMAARVAVDRDDVALAERALSMMNDEDAAGSAVHRELAVWGHRVVAGDVVGAVTSAEAAGAAAQTPFQRIHAACMLAATLAFLDRWDDARAALRRVDDALAAVTEPAPRPRASAAVTRTAVALAAGQLGEADDAAHRALQLAGTAGLRLIQVDALESVAAVALAGGDPTRAARLLAATSAERGRRGYHGRFTSPVSAPTVGRLAGEHPAAWSEGARLTLDEATELARRRRGPRGRPRFGIGALTPTEQLVVGLVSRGRTNAEIAGELLIAVPTVKTHLTRTYAKLGVRNRAELVALVTRGPPLG
jgi:DNA-binding CsgD family transcriptional regulator